MPQGMLLFTLLSAGDLISLQLKSSLLLPKGHLELFWDEN